MALKSYEITCPKCGKTAYAISHPGPIKCPECGDIGLAVFVCERTKKGFPALWEQGGGATNTGEAQVITGPHGEKLKPIYVKTRGPRACGQHALFVVQPNYHVIQVWYWNKQRPPYSVAVYQIQEITEFTENPDKPDNKKLLAIAKIVDTLQFLEPAIDVAKQKARCYHCRTPHWAQF
jgi:DNA-directed RNA polymerase subunit RPC12/RpoP